MKVFISWSGAGSASQMVAEALAEWLPDVLPSVEPFYSTEDIKKGQIWFDKIAKELDESDFGILCLTPLNLTSPWLLFEAGAIAKHVGQGKVVPLMIGANAADLTPPLSMFNGVIPGPREIRRLVDAINDQLGEQKRDEKRLDRVFEKWWPDLEQKLEGARRHLEGEQKAHGSPKKRAADDILEEILELVRSLSRSQSNTLNYLHFFDSPVGRGLLSSGMAAQDVLGDGSVQLDKPDEGRRGIRLHAIRTHGIGAPPNAPQGSKRNALAPDKPSAPSKPDDPKK